MKSSLARHEDVLQADFNYLASIMEGESQLPEDLDEATSLYLQEVIEMSKENTLDPNRAPDITKEHFSSFWSRVRETTQSSPYGLHYGTYKAAAKDEYASEALALQLTLVARSGVYPKRWESATQLLMAKSKGECDKDNCRYLILYEADFNFFKHHFVGDVANDSINNIGKMPEEHLAKKGCTSVDATFDSILATDICRQSQITMAIASVDASQCYDRVLHLMLWFVWYSLIKIKNVCQTIISCLQLMSFYQRSGFGDSSTSYGGRNSEFRWDGLGQGSRGASHGWLHISAPMINIIKRLGLWSEFEHPITREKAPSVGTAFVDDANMYSGGSVGDSLEDVKEQASTHVKAWAVLLKVSGGCAKANKSFWYLMHQIFKDGKWQWQDTQNTELQIPVDDDKSINIKSLPLNQEKKFLGVYASPEGGNKKQLEKILEKATVWIQRMKNAHLPSYLGWLAYGLKLWPSIRYGLGAMTNDMEEISTLLDKQDYDTMNSLGVASTIKKGWRKLHSTFRGIGLYDLVT